ncbi:uncharacterized protein LOC122019564 [Zingiber officinale]|uniref:uncharacterized protein LOC122019564 n=1 Tax=Zingiber officinale TaxID=94328 RepID=UPI001C4DB4E5|nr:uncharacterized protein LOC122019564 [Zingiber officinale]
MEDAGKPNTITLTQEDMEFLINSRRVLDDPLLKRYQNLNVGKYSGITDLEDHLAKFENASLLQQFSDGAKCRINQRYHKTPWSLFSIKQGPKESIRAYIKRLNQVAIDVPNTTTKLLVSAFSQGLNDNDFFKDLVRNPPTNFDLLIERTTEFINVEEAQAARKKEGTVSISTTVHEGAIAPVHPPRGPCGVPPPPRQPERRPQAFQHTEMPQEAPRRWCAYHISGTHYTENCFTLRNQRTNNNRYHRRSPNRHPYHRHNSPPKREYQATEIQHGTLQVSGGPSRTHELAQPEIAIAQQEENRSSAAQGNINMITGGSTDGDSNRARKAHTRRLQIHAVGCSAEKAVGPEISFDPKDPEGVEVAHDDALIIKAVIANYNISHTFIDIGSSVNIIFKKAFDQLQIDPSELQPMATPLYGFTGNEVQPLDQIKLAISLGEEPLMRTRRSYFMVVDAPSVYNVILGRPALNEFRTIVCTFCQKVKFSVDDQV